MIKDNAQGSEKNKAKKPAKTTRKRKIKYSLLTFLLGIFIVQLLWGVIVNSAKIYSLRTKIIALEHINVQAQRKNTFLREELEKYTSNSGLEALARNRLQFSKEDETLVIIKTQQPEDEAE